MSLEIKYVKKSCLAHEPKIATSGSAGFDLFAADLFIIYLHFIYSSQSLIIYYNRFFFFFQKKKRLVFTIVSCKTN